MMSVQAQEMLEHLERQQNRIALWLAAGFAIGFIIGLIAAWTVAHP